MMDEVKKEVEKFKYDTNNQKNNLLCFEHHFHNKKLMVFKKEFVNYCYENNIYEYDKILQLNIKKIENYFYSNRAKNEYKRIYGAGRFYNFNGETVLSYIYSMYTLEVSDDYLYFIINAKNIINLNLSLIRKFIISFYDLNKIKYKPFAFIHIYEYENNLSYKTFIEELINVLSYKISHIYVNYHTDILIDKNIFSKEYNNFIYLTTIKKYKDWSELLHYKNFNLIVNKVDINKKIIYNKLLFCFLMLLSTK